MAQGFGKRQDSTDVIKSSSYTARCTVSGMGGQDVILDCGEIVGKKKDEARQIALKHAKTEAPKKFKGRKVKVSSVVV